MAVVDTGIDLNKSFPLIRQDLGPGRFYELSNGTIVPSCSTVANGALPKDKHLIDWIIKESGGDPNKAANLQSFASRIGGGVHDLCEIYVNGGLVDISSNDIDNYVETFDIVVPPGGVNQFKKHSNLSLAGAIIIIQR